MSGQNKTARVILVDMGNSRIKAAQIQDPSCLIVTCTSLEEFCDWLLSQSVDRLICASVRDETHHQQLSAFCIKCNIELSVIRTESDFSGLANSYSDVSTMGVDRWLSMVACHHKTSLPFAVLMFGTAITCDIVADNKHIGGWIIPGRQLMQDALTQNTARVFANESNADMVAMGNSTPQCVDFGCFAAATGVVLTAQQYLRSKFSQYCIFLTGGDDNLLTSLKGNDIVRADNLVLQGLSRYANYR